MLREFALFAREPITYYEQIQKRSHHSGVYFDDDARAWIICGAREIEIAFEQLLFRRDCSIKEIWERFVDNKVVAKELVRMCTQQFMFSNDEKVSVHQDCWRSFFKSTKKTTVQEILTRQFDTIFPTISGHGSIDIYSELVDPLVLGTMVELMHLEDVIVEESRGDVKAYLNLFGSRLRTNEEVELSAHAIQRLLKRFLSAIDKVPNGGIGADDFAIAANRLLAFIVSLESTSYLIGNTILQLSGDCHGLEQDENRATSIKNLGRESLRYDSSVQIASRYPVESFKVSGHEIKANDKVIFHFAAANHDSRVIFAPERYEPNRDYGPIKSFGYGRYVCPGQHIAISMHDAFLKILLDRVQLDKFRVSSYAYDPGIAGRAFNHITVDNFTSIVR